jgi:hypothetical protein
MSWIEIAPGLWKANYVTKIGVDCNAMALRLADGSLAVLSPPTNHDARLFDEIDALGKVSALIAPNVGHDAGQIAWQARYRDATVHAPAVSAPKIAKAKPTLRPFASIDSLAPRMAAGTSLLELPGTSSGAVALTVQAGSERVLVLDDCMTNGATLSGPAPFRFLFWLTGSGPGLARSKIWFFAFCKDKPAFVKSVLDEWDRLGPTKIAFLHGDEAGRDRIAEARAQLAAAVA